MMPLNPLTFPLSGSHLIEASAGTGKTYTIAFLYLRLILGHGTLNGGRPLTPPEILVMTFTEAATHELRSRIRQRLSEAAHAFRTDMESSDDLLNQLRAHYPNHQWSTCAQRLENAIAWMDESAISTIHSWCQRMLHEHAFASQSLFTLQLESKPDELLNEVIRDYWRNFYHPLSPAEVAICAKFWTTPDELAAHIRPLLAHIDLVPESDAPQHLIPRLTQEKQLALERLKSPWRLWARELCSLLEEARESGFLDGRKLKADHYQAWFSTLYQWADGDDSDVDIEAVWTRFSSPAIDNIWKSKAAGHPLCETFARHPGIAGLSILKKELDRLPDPRVSLLCHASRWVWHTFSALRQQHALITFDDLLSQLELALHGPHGKQLASQIRQQFPAALIDEFQDTDPIQYRLFEKIYDPVSNPQDCTLILIGDPKQAIYAFRGADIHTYLQASRAIAGRCHTLNTNYRSTLSQVAVVNHLFNHAEQRPHGHGAFLFREQDNPLPFLPVQARGHSQFFMVRGQPQTALTLVLCQSENGKPLSNTSYIKQMAESCANQIMVWLDESAHFAGDSEPRPVRPRDMAVLVNDRFQAKTIRQTLASHGIRSVFLSEQGSVYETPQAEEIFRWLSAIAMPDDPRRLRAALATPSLHLTLAELDQLNHDEYAWEQRWLQFRAYRNIWQEQGVLPVLQRLMTDFQVHDFLLSLDYDAFEQSGERILTDLLHLAELLQQTSTTLEGDHALLRALELAIHDSSSVKSGEAQRLRLESDQERVQIVTIHKSKGLEYPLVLIPFISTCRPITLKDLPRCWHGQSGQRQLFFHATDEELLTADRERLAEDMRKLYVAMTRARHATWMGITMQEGKAAIDHLLGTTTIHEMAHHATIIQQLVQQSPDMVLLSPDSLAAQHISPRLDTPPLRITCHSQRTVMDDWWIASFSTLIDHNRIGYRGDNVFFEKFSEERQTHQSENRCASPLAAPWHHFPRGALAGTLLHDLLEWAAKQGFSSLLDKPLEWREAIARRCHVRHWQTWIDPLLTWLQHLLSKSITLPTGSVLCLGKLDTCLAEMEFWLTVPRVALVHLDACLSRHTLASHPRPPLHHNMLNGMLKGFIDLVFEHDGRYYVMDYKSNWLAPDDSGYDLPTLRQAMAEQRYDLQFALYLLALHRLLRVRLKNYDYDQHMGGICYWFLRGVDSPSAGIYHERPAKTFIETLDNLLSEQTT